jgi:hypothetical protein
MGISLYKDKGDNAQLKEETKECFERQDGTKTESNRQTDSAQPKWEKRKPSFCICQV